MPSGLLALQLGLALAGLSAGWRWIAAGFAIFRRNPPMLAMLVITYWFIMIFLNIVPLIVCFGASPQSIRALIGRGAWRRAATNSVSRNMRILHAMGRSKLREDEPSPDIFVRLLEFPSGVLRAVNGATDDERIAARITPRRKPVDFQNTVHLVADTKRMLADAFNPMWSYARMWREHEEASRQILRGKFSEKRFAEPWAFKEAGFTAELLTSALDIAAEGGSMHHCVASYAKLASHGSYAVFRIEGRERATAGVRFGRLDQVYGACNANVSDECDTFARKLASEYAAARPMQSRAA